MMNEKIDIPVWEKYTLTWYVMNGNRILIKKKQFEKFMDKTDVI